MHTMRLKTQWDPRKSAANWRKHGVRFSDVEAVFEDPNAITLEDPDARDEQRFVSIGLDSLGRLAVVVYTHRGAHLRVISARKATRNEARTYARRI